MFALVAGAGVLWTLFWILVVVVAAVVIFRAMR